MVRLLSVSLAAAVAVAAVALLAATSDASSVHIHASAASTPSPSPNASSGATTELLTGQEVGNSILISNGTLTTCTKQQWTYSQPNAPFVSVHFAKFHILEGDDVTIATPDGSSSMQVNLPGGVLSTQGFSSDRVPGPTAVVTFTPKGCLSTNPLPSDFRLEIDALEYTYKVAKSSLVNEDREICGAANQNQPAVCFKKAANVSPTVHKKARAVARLLKNLGAGNPQVACTGFLVGSEGHLMTNNHCIKDAAEANSTNFEFMVESPTCDLKSCISLGECSQYGKVESRGAEFLYTNKQYDFTIVKLRSKPCVVNGKYSFLSLRAKESKKGEAIYIVQHPSGGGKVITLQQDAKQKGDDDDDGVDDDDDSTDDSEDSTDDADKSDKSAGEDDDDSTKGKLTQTVIAAVNDENNLGTFWTSYYADTEGGSSGSPVLSLNDHSVLALHANGACPNSGTPSNLIVEDIKKNSKSVKLPDDAFA